MKLLNEFNLQLYSLRDVMGNNFVGTLEKLGNKGFGYTGVEFAGFGGLSVDEMKKALADNGLRPLSSHTGIERLLNATDEEIEYQKALGIEYIICPWADMETKADALEVAKKLTPVAEKIAAAGMKFGYHNHAHEFIMEDGEYLLDILFDNLPKGTILELDIFWSEYANVDSLAYMEKHKDRLEILHVKQIGEGKKNAELDKGFIDFEDVIKKSKAMGVKHFVYEQEEHEVSSLQSVENGVKYIFSL